MLEAADEGGRHEFGLTGEFDRGDPRYQFGEETVHLHAGQCGAQAEVHAVAEGQVLVGIATDVEAHRIGEDVLVAVGRDIAQQYRLALGDLHTAHLGVGLGGAHELLDRHDAADHLLDRGAHQARILLQPGQFTGIAQQFQQPAGDTGTGGVMTGAGHDHVIGQRVHI